MIKVLFPRFPFSEHEFNEMLEKKRQAFFKQKFHPKNKHLFEEEILAFQRQFPMYQQYVLWKGGVDGIVFLYGIDSIFESEYLIGSKEWEEYQELERQLIYEQHLPFDSPEWQAVIEKYKRKGNSYRFFID